jgi:hypothetical protein
VVLGADLGSVQAQSDRALLQRNPDQWFWALEAITQENPVPPAAAGKVHPMAVAWVAWGKRQGYMAA